MVVSQPPLGPWTPHEGNVPTCFFLPSYVREAYFNERRRTLTNDGGAPGKFHRPLLLAAVVRKIKKKALHAKSLMTTAAPY